VRFLRAELPAILAIRTDVLSPRMSRVIEALAERTAGGQKRRLGGQPAVSALRWTSHLGH
jgi:hypothetical protein